MVTFSDPTTALGIEKTDKHLARLISKKRQRAQINKIRNEKGEVTTAATEI